MAKTKSKNPKSKGSMQVVQIPRYLLDPIGKFFKDQLKSLEHRKKDIEEEDPFSDADRLVDNASPDTDAAEQFGHARAAAIKEQLERKIVQTQKAMTKVKRGTYGVCEDCGGWIDTDRLMVYPEAEYCAKCKKKRE